ncbi:MAG: enoyl-CoA hydratase/isomerase family protein [Myxococcota bacterium]
MPTDAVLFEIRPKAIGLVTLNRPANRNSMTRELLDAFGDAIDQCLAADLRALVITGRGHCFSAGADFKDVVQREGGLPHERSYAMYAPFLRVLEVSVPVIAAMNGHAVGGGFGLSLLADLRYAAEDAKYGANFARLGIHPGMGISYLLPQLIGVPRANDLLFTGRLVLGREAASFGLVNEAVPAAEVLDRALAVADRIAMNAPVVIRETKRTLREFRRWTIEDAARREAFVQAETLETEDAAEGVAALLEKRSPEFQGR